MIKLSLRNITPRMGQNSNIRVYKNLKRNKHNSLRNVLSNQTNKDIHNYCKLKYNISIFT